MWEVLGKQRVQLASRWRRRCHVPLYKGRGAREKTTTGSVATSERASEWRQSLYRTKEHVSSDGPTAVLRLGLVVARGSLSLA
jgi:hypothetical protein